MEFYLPRYIDNLNLPRSRSSQPLFEAIFNSIQAVQVVQHDGSNGHILITVHRSEDDQPRDLFGLKRSVPLPILNFIVEDDGIGFDEENYKSFRTGGSPYKPRAKGIGRMYWLKAFESIHVDSVFMEDGSFKQRTFDFVISEDGVENDKLEPSSKQERKTTISLIGLRQPYQDTLKQSPNQIAEQIIDHFLIYFLSKKCPSIVLIDGTETLDLNILFGERVHQQGAKEPFKIKDQQLTIIHLRLYASSESPKVYLCGDGLAVGEPLNLLNDIADLKERLRNDAGRPFVYEGYVEGAYLDNHIDEKRAEFNIPKTAKDVHLLAPIPLEEIRDEIVSRVKTHLASFLQPITEGKLARIKKYVHTHAPQYRPILKYRPDVLDRLQPGLSDEKLDAELYKINADIHAELRTAYQHLLKTRQDITTLHEYKEKFGRLVETLNDVSKSELALYVVHRKLILDLLETTTSADKDGTYPKEEKIHHLIYPMKTTSDDVVPYEQQNLWIIDERLAFHKYLASDKELLTHLPTSSAMRPDIVIFGFDTNPFSSVAIIEFKRAMRDLTGRDNDPVAELCSYADAIAKGRVNIEEGRPIKTHSATQFYCTYICDIKDDLREGHIRLHNLLPSPDRLEYFGYVAGYQAYIHIIDYTRLTEDAKKRNQVLFEKLDIKNA